MKSKSHRNDGSAMRDIISPPNGFRGTLERKGITPKNHEKDNKNLIKEIQKILKTQPTIEPPKNLTANKFENVQSKVTTRGETPKIDQVKSLDYIKTNIQRIPTIKGKKFEPIPNIDFRTIYVDHCKTPEYIGTIKEELKTTKAQADYELSKLTWPKGTILVPENDRQAHLQELYEKRDSFLALLNRLPFTSNTEAVRMKKGKIEEKLKEVEREISTYSLPKVFIPKQ
ncbi:unnamed protein product [Blepharisma stoltei]|uniref:Enkurin domain-containing protein n=1 Tax=Blepharisma stoltei TaxID=1481888 RepID=A0AAU9K6H8_9CILI|nr:unnamed protein product [Blepharisma stoltei]